MLLKWLETQEEPEQSVSLESSVTQYYWLNNKTFVLIDGLVYAGEGPGMIGELVATADVVLLYQQ